MIKYEYKIAEEMSMISIHPVSDLRNNYPKIESLVEQGQPVYLTKNGHGKMVVLNLDLYERLTNDIDLKLLEADKAARLSDVRLGDEEVFGKYVTA